MVHYWDGEQKFVRRRGTWYITGTLLGGWGCSDPTGDTANINSVTYNPEYGISRVLTLGTSMM